MAHGPWSNADFADALQRRSLVETLTDPTQAAGLAAESLRWLNHLLGRFHAAADVYDVVASLAYCMEAMPQALQGLTEYLDRQQGAGRLRRDDGADVVERVAAVEVAVEEARRSVWRAARALRDAHNALADVSGPVPEGDDGA
jgi:hypothetical protein